MEQWKPKMKSTPLAWPNDPSPSELHLTLNKLPTILCCLSWWELKRPTLKSANWLTKLSIIAFGIFGAKLLSFSTGANGIHIQTTVFDPILLSRFSWVWNNHKLRELSFVPFCCCCKNARNLLNDMKFQQKKFFFNFSCFYPIVP